MTFPSNSISLHNFHIAFCIDYRIILPSTVKNTKLMLVQCLEASQQFAPKFYSIWRHWDKSELSTSHREILFFKQKMMFYKQFWRDFLFFNRKTTFYKQFWRYFLFFKRKTAFYKQFRKDFLFFKQKKAFYKQLISRHQKFLFPHCI